MQSDNNSRENDGKIFVPIRVRPFAGKGYSLVILV